MRRHVSIVFARSLAYCLLASIGLCLTGPAQAAPDQSASAATSGKCLLPEKTEIRLRITRELKSGGSKAGEDVPYLLSDDLYTPGSHILLLPAGTPAYGKITQSSRRGMFGQGGKLKFTCDYVLAPDGTHIPLRADPILVRGTDNRGATAAVTILLSPLGVLINGKDVTVKKDQEFTMYVDKDTLVTPYAASSATSEATTPAAVPIAQVALAHDRSMRSTVPSAAPISPLPEGPTHQVFLLKNNARITGNLLRYNGFFFWVATSHGTKKISTHSVAAIDTEYASRHY